MLIGLSLGIRCASVCCCFDTGGASVVEMQIAGRWKSAQVPAHYAEAELAERGAIAKYKKNNHQVNHH